MFSKRILVVEDDAAVRLGLTLALEAKGFDVNAAESGQQALSLAAAEVPNVLICDWQLGEDGLDGVDVAHEIRARVAADTPLVIIMMTARDLSELRARAIDLPVKAFLRKPVRLSALVDALA